MKTTGIGSYSAYLYDANAYKQVTKSTEEDDFALCCYEAAQENASCQTTSVQIESNQSRIKTLYDGKTLEEWASTDPKYTDAETGISWYVRDGKQPYMTGEDTEKLKKLCQETGEPWLKKFAELTGTIQYLDEDTVAYIGENGTAIKSKDGRELFLDTSAMSYDAIMNMFSHLPKNGNYFDDNFWQEQMAEVEDTKDSETEPITPIENFAEIFRKRAEEILEKLERGDTKTSYRIGGQSFTEEEWNTFLERFDSIQEAVWEALKEEQEQKEKVIIEDEMELLTTDCTTCTYPLNHAEEDNTLYITWYTEDGIFCRKMGQSEGYQWVIPFENKEQYEKVMEFLRNFPSDWNLRFAANEDFWKDFLNDEIDMDGFMEFMESTNKGVPDVSITEDSVYANANKMQWIKYMTPSATSFYINPNSKTLTTNLNNAKLFEKETFSAIGQNLLRPVEDVMAAVKTPMNLAEQFFVQKRTNTISIALGTSITVAGGFTLVVGEKHVEVLGRTELDNQKESQEASDMAGALATLLRNAGGTLKEVGYDTPSKTKWTENVTKILQYFGIDTSRDFTVNGMKYTKDENGNFISIANKTAIEEREKLQAANQTYTYADENTKQMLAYRSAYFLQDAPKMVADAWQETLEETGVHPFAEGKTSVLLQIAEEHDVLTGGNDRVFGETIESSVATVETILKRIDTAMEKNEESDAYLKEQKVFYSVLLSKISSNEKYTKTKSFHA